MTVNKATLDLIKEFEGYRGTAYKDSVGVWTIGYGTTAAAGVGITPYVGLTINEPQAEEYLLAAIAKFEAQIRPHVGMSPNENEWGAMVSLAYNIGPGAFINSTLLRKWNSGDKRGAADQFLVWNRAGGKVLNGLVRRRQAERDLFLTPVSTYAPTPPTNPLIAIMALLRSIFGVRK